MKKYNYLEIVGVLSLSFLLTTTYSISGSVPAMLETFHMYPRSSVEMLVSLPSTAMMVMIALTPFLSRILSSHVRVILGLLLVGTTGMIPVFSQSYPIVLIGRALLGVGLGLTNTCAVSLIGERFQGTLRTRLQGIRCSMETLGQSAMTLVAGQLLLIRWNYAFFIYGIGLVILLMYLTMVPRTEAEFSEELPEDNKNYKLTGKDWFFCIQNFFMAVVIIIAVCLNNLRISSLVIEKNIGEAVDGANVLSIAVFVGFLGGLVFGKLFQLLKERIIPLFLISTAAGLLIMYFAGSIPLMAIGSSLGCFSTTIFISALFNRISDHLPRPALTTANSITLVGCNLGATITPFILGLIEKIDPSIAVSFLAVSIGFMLLAALMLLTGIKKHS